MCLLTYNIHADVPVTDESVRAIRESGADLVALQEVRSDAEARIRREFHGEYPFIVAQATKGGWDGLMLMSKYRLSHTRLLPRTAEAWFPALTATMATPAGEVQVLTVHLRPRIADKGGAIIGHFTVGPMHRREIEAYFGQLTNEQPMLILGDFNEDNDGPAVTYLEQRGLTNALPQFDRKTPTFDGEIFGVPLKGRVDHVLFSGQFTVRRANVVENRGSDHRPVRAEVEWRVAR